jgi:ferric-dicitrate binding protein FerR (iron transport regulator)
MASRQHRQTSHIFCGAAVVLLCAGTVGSAWAQSGACVLTPDKRNPNETILRCGSELTITPAAGTVYRPAAAAEDGLPASIQLDSGALLIEFNSKRRREFQILTPQAVASVRGTKWAMEVKPGQTSALVLLGQVTVARKDAAGEVVVGPGQEVDISSGTPATRDPWTATPSCRRSRSRNRRPTASRHCSPGLVNDRHAPRSRAAR